MKTTPMMATAQMLANTDQWQRLPTPKTLLAALAVDTQDLQEMLGGLEEGELNEWPDQKRAEAAEEMADMVMYLLLLCDKLGIDLEQAVRQKIDDNRDRFFNHH